MTPAVATAQRWTDALAGLYQVPDDFRVGYFDRAGALDVLRCGEEVFEELLAAGLGHTGGPGEERYDRYDLFNLALASGSGASVPEKAIGYALRWMNRGARPWTERLEWSFAATVGCPQDSCGADPSFAHARMLPGLAGGELLAWEAGPGVHDGTGDDGSGGTGPGAPGTEPGTPGTEPGAPGSGRVRLDGPGPLAFSARVATRGHRSALRSPVLRRIVDDFLAAGYRWVRVPERLQWDHRRMLAAGVAPCISASLFLAEQFEQAGYRAFARRGWLLGILDLAHSWVEVEDDDGVVRPVDPIAGWLSAYADRPDPDFAQAAIGSWLNRQLPADLPADGLMAEHRCGGQDREPTRTTTIRRTSTTPQPHEREQPQQRQQPLQEGAV